MKTYPSILSYKIAPLNFDAYTFCKLDGRSMRAEWTKKRGWFKFGSREVLFDESELHLGRALPAFRDKLAEPLTKLAIDQRYESLVVFVEAWVPGTTAGIWPAHSPLEVAVIDLAPNAKELIAPRPYFKLMEKYDIAHAALICYKRWNQPFVERVRACGLVTSQSDEGVIGKSGEGKKLIMRKAKTQAWTDRVRAFYGDKVEKMVDL